MQKRMPKCKTYVKRPKVKPPIKRVPSRNISSGYYNRDYPVDLSIVVHLQSFPTLRFFLIWCYKLQTRERARGARRKNDRQPHPLLFGRWGSGVTKNLVEYLVEWPPKIEKNITPVMVLLQVAL